MTTNTGKFATRGQILPDAMFGVVGGGQLGRMMLVEARRMGYRTAVFATEANSPAAQVADVVILAALSDVAAAEKFARQCHVVTLETEHVPLATLERIAVTCPLHPAPRVLATISDRWRQRSFMRAIDVPQTPHVNLETSDDLRAAAALTFPAVLKTRRSGYDGKGQIRVPSAEDLVPAWKILGGAPCVLETFVRFECEISVLLARSLDGVFRVYAVVENEHRNHVLHTSRVPAQVSKETAGEAERLTARIAESLGHVGMLAAEFFVTADGALLLNEVAPRPHNSGHYTLGACETSQFEQHVRAVCGLALGETTLLRPAGMLNLLGDLWRLGDPSWAPVLSHPGAKLHLYGKPDASPGRKMGHVLLLADDAVDACAQLEAIERKLSPHDEGVPCL